MTIYIFGNTTVPTDSAPVQLIPELEQEFPNITFELADPTESWSGEHNHVIVLDTVIGLKQPKTFDSLQAFDSAQKRLTLHDYDLYTDLALLQKIGTLQKITIIGIPPDYNKLSDTLISQIKKAVSST